MLRNHDAIGTPTLCTALAGLALGCVGTHAAEIIVQRDPGVADNIEIQTAVDAAEPGDTIVFPSGVYAFEDEVEIAKDLVLRSQDPGSRAILDGTNSTQHMHIDGGTVVLQDFLFRDGRSTGLAGGAILLSGGSGSARLDVVRCEFRNNQTDVRGGAIGAGTRARGPLGGLTIRDAVFVNNSAGTDGGAVAFINGARGSITASRFERNDAAGSGGAAWAEGSADIGMFGSTFRRNEAADSGGAVYLTNVDEADLRGCLILDNDALTGGGLLAESGGSLHIERSRIIENTATERAGGLSVRSVDADVVWCDISQNHSQNNQGGGVVAYEDTTLDVYHSTITGNVVESGGGGLALFATSQTTIAQCLIADNTAGGSGGGIRLFNSATVDIDNATVAGNVAGEDGGGIRAEDVNVVKIDNSIFWGNTAASGSLRRQNLDVTVGEGDDIDFTTVEGLTGDLAGTMNNGDDPRFVLPEAGDFRLAQRSSAIDSGNSNARPSDLFDFDADGNFTERYSLDLDGADLHFNDPGIASTGVGDLDRGAYEFRADSGLLPCNAADNAEPYGLLELSDITFFISTFSGGCN